MSRADGGRRRTRSHPDRLRVSQVSATDLDDCVSVSGKVEAVGRSTSTLEGPSGATVSACRAERGLPSVTTEAQVLVTGVLDLHHGVTRLEATAIAPALAGPAASPGPGGLGASASEPGAMPWPRGAGPRDPRTLPGGRSNPLVPPSGTVPAVTNDAVVVAAVRAESALAQSLVAAYFAELDERLPGGFDPDRSVPAPPEELDPPEGRFLVARLDGRPVGCGGVRRIGVGVAEVKRMWVDPAVRGRGVGRRLLEALERRALVELGCTVVRLDTSHLLQAAVGLYRAAGYREIQPYNENTYATLWFEKRLDAEPGDDKYE